MTLSSRKKRICHIISGLDTGGAERNLFNLLNTNIGQKYDHMVISLKTEGTFGPRIRELLFEVHCISDADGHKHPFRTFRALHRFRPDLLQGWMYHGNVAASLAKPFLPGNPLTTWNIRHCVYDIYAEKPITRQVIRLGSLLSRAPTAIIFNAFTARDQHTDLGYLPTRTTVIPNGFDTNLFRPCQHRRNMIRRSIGLSDDAFVVGHVGRLHPMKGHKAFLKAMISLMEAQSHVHAVMSGRDVTSETLEITQEIPASLTNRFHLMGDYPDVPTLMNGFDLFVQSASSEAFPNVLGEAMASGLACITTDAGDSGIVLGDAGWTVPIENHPALCTAIESACADPILCEQNGRAARDRIVSCYGTNLSEDRYQALYSELFADQGIF